MSHLLEAIKKKPLRYWPVDTTPPFIDYSGYGGNGTASTTPIKGVSVAHGALNSSVFDKACVATLPAPGVFVQGREHVPFSIGANVRTVNVTNNDEPEIAYRENLIIAPNAASNSSGSIVSMGSAGGTTTYGTDAFLPSGRYVRKSWASGSGAMGFGYMTGTVGIGTYTFSYWIRTNLTGANVYNVEGTASEVNSSFGIVTVANTWKYVSGTFQVTSAGTLKIGGYVNGTTTGDYIDIASPLLEKTSTVGNYFDGNTAGYEWSGTVDSSISRSIRGISIINHARNPSAVAGLSIFTAQHGTASYTTTNGKFGTTSVRATRTTAGLGDNRLNHTNTNYFTIGQDNIYAEAWVYSPTALSFTLELQAITPNNTSLFPKGAATAVPANTWTKIFVNYDNTVTKIHKLTGVQIWQSGQTNNGDWMEGDGWFVGEAPPKTGYFDGSFAGAEWQGTADQSPSYMLVSNAEQQVLGNLNQLDGLVVNGSEVSFVTKYLTTGECRVTYDLQVPREVNIVGTYGIDRNMLWVDGILVGETEITPEQKVDKFVASDNNLYSGTTISSQKISVNGLGVWSKVLTGKEISEVNQASSRYFETNSVEAPYGGMVVDIYQPSKSIFLKQVTNTEEQWRTGQLSDVALIDDSLVPTFSSNISIPGYWLGTFNLGQAQTNPIFGTNINWDGEGVIVEVSLDAITWEICSQGSNPILTNGINPTDKIMFVRVTFPGGIVEDPSYINSLTITGFSTGTNTELNDRTVTFTNPIDLNTDAPVNQLRDDWGIHLKGGSLSIGSSSDTARTLEVWVKFDDLAYGAGGLGSATPYQNGGSYTGVRVGEWFILHYANPTNLGTMSLTGNIQVGRVVLYPTQLSASEISDIYKAYTGQNVIKATDVSSVGITESAAGASLYAHDWTIVSTG